MRRATLLTLWPLALFAFLLGALYLAVAFPARLEPLGLLVLRMVRHPGMALPVLSGLAGVGLNLALQDRLRGEETAGESTRAVSFGVASVALYGFLLWVATYGIGR